MLFAGIGSVFGQTNQVNVKWNYAGSIINVEFYNETKGVYSYSNTGDFTFTLETGYDYQLYIYNNNIDVFPVTSILVGEDDRTAEYDPENGHGYIEISNLSTDLNINITATKVENTKTITLNRDADIVSYELDKKNDTYGYWSWVAQSLSDETKTAWDVIPGGDYRMLINLVSQFVYKISSVTMDEKDITSDFKRNNCIDFQNLSGDHVVTVVTEKIGETKNITVEGADWNKGYVIFCDPVKDKEIGTIETTEFLVGSTIQMSVVTKKGWKVKTLTVDNTDVTESYETNGYYEFKNLSDDHAVNVEFEEAQMFTITPTFTKGWIDLFCSSDYVSPSSGDVVELNEGWDVTMRCPAVYSIMNEQTWEDEYYFVSVKIDGNIVDLDKNENDEYLYVFKNLSANHTIELVFEKCPTITVNMDASINDVRYYSDNNVPFTKNTNVTMVLYPEEGQAIKSIKYTVEGSEDVIDITDDYNNGYTYTFENLDKSVYVNVEYDWVGTEFITVEYDATSPKGKTYFKTATSKWEGNGGEFTIGSDVTIFIEPTPGYEVKNLHLYIDEAWEWNAEQGEHVKVVEEFDDDVDVQYDAATDEYYYVISNFRSRTSLTISTQKKAYPAGLENVSYTLADLGDGTGEGTFCSEYDLDFKDVEGITAYIASGFNPDNGNIVLTKVWDVPRGTGVMIRGISGTYQIPVTTSNYYFRNLLVGIVKDLDPLPITEWIYDVEYTNFTLKQVPGEPRALFYKSTGQKLGGHKAYLQLPTYMIPKEVSGTRGIGYEFDDDATSLKDLMIFEDTESGDYYNLQGQKVQNPGKGIYIKNGKKVIIR
jgi:hypothetical protein